MKRERAFDRRDAFEQAVEEMTKGTIRALWEHVERQFEKAVGKVRRGLDEADAKEFWKRAREAARSSRAAD